MEGPCPAGLQSWGYCSPSHQPVLGCGCVSRPTRTAWKGALEQQMQSARPLISQGPFLKRLRAGRMLHCLISRLQ